VTPREYIEMGRERWRSIVAGLLVGVVAAIAAAYLVPDEYRALTTVLVSSRPPTSPAAGSTSDSEDISTQQLFTYIELLHSKRLAQDVITSLKLNVTPDDLAGRITVTNVPDSPLLTATVTDRSPEQAVRIANSVAEEFTRTVAELGQQPADPSLPPAVTAEVFQPAELPAEQFAPRPVLYVALGAVLGLVLGLTAAVLRHTLDTRVRNRRQLERALGVSVLGTIGHDRDTTTSPLVMSRAPHSQLAEEFRQLRTNVQFMSVDSEHKVILVTSACPGEGRSTTVCNLGLALAEAGMSVLIVDADLRRPAVARLTSIDGTLGLAQVLVDRIPVERVLQSITSTLDVLPSGLLPPNPSELLGSNQMAQLIRQLRTSYDVVLVDTAPLLRVTDAAVLAPRTDGVLLVVRQGRTVVQEVQAANDALHAVSARLLGSVLTPVPQMGSLLRAGRRNGGPRPLAPVPVPTQSE
jgi:capsular exopolysaccharide synthesis family protein